MGTVSGRPEAAAASVCFSRSNRSAQDLEVKDVGPAVVSADVDHGLHPAQEIERPRRNEYFFAPAHRSYDHFTARIDDACSSLAARRLVFDPARLTLSRSAAWRISSRALLTVTVCLR